MGWNLINLSKLSYMWTKPYHPFELAKKKKEYNKGRWDYNHASHDDRRR